MRTQITNPTVTSTRSGAVLVVALICLLLLSVLAASLTRTVLLQREQVIREEWQLQAEWLAEAAVDRAVVRLNSIPEYEGEEWRPHLNDEGVSLGQVHIVIAPEESETGFSLTRIDVTADVPADTRQRVRVQRTATVRIPRRDED